MLSSVERNSFLFKVDSRRRNPNLLATPVNLHLEVTNRCNLSCRTCGRNYWDKELNPLGDMSMETVLKLDAYFKRAACVNVWGYGESLLSPHFFDIMDHCKTFKGTLQLFTNGTTLTENNVKKLLEKNLDSLVISLDGATNDTVGRTRSGASLDDLICKITALNELKEKCRALHPNLSLSFTATQGNITELPDLIALAARLKIGTLNVSVARIFHPSLAQDSLLHDAASALKAFSEAQQMGRDRGVQVNVPDLIDKGCRQPFELIFVKWNGDVFGCCASAFYSVPRFQIFLGNVHDQSLDSMWNGEHAKHVRRGLLGQGRLHETCGRCPYHRMTLENLQKYPRRSGSS